MDVQKESLKKRTKKETLFFVCVENKKDRKAKRNGKYAKRRLKKKTGNHKNQMNFLCSRKYERRIRNISKMFSGSELKCNSLSVL